MRALCVRACVRYITDRYAPVRYVAFHDSPFLPGEGEDHRHAERDYKLTERDARASFSCRLLINHRRFAPYYARTHAHARTGPAHPRFSHYTHARERELMPGVSHTCTRTWAPVFHRMKEKSGELPRLPASLFSLKGALTHHLRR